MRKNCIVMLLADGYSVLAEISGLKIHEEEQGLLFVAWELFGLALNISETAESV